MQKFHRVYLGTGTNLGNRQFNLKHANALIENRIGSIRKASTVYQTTAWGVTEQPNFYNQVIEVATLLSPESVLVQITEIESLMGRIRLQKWGTRLIDIDILFYDDIFIQKKDLTIPHPYITDRNFVLIPLAEIAEKLIHPVLGTSIKTLLEACEDVEKVEKVLI